MEWSGRLPEEFGSPIELRAMVRYLNELGYTESVKSQNGVALAVQLSHKGLKRREFHRQEVIAYLEEKWIDFFSMVISIAALAISIVALLLRFPG